MPSSHHRELVAQLVGRVARPASRAGRHRAGPLGALDAGKLRPASKALAYAAEGLRPGRSGVQLGHQMGETALLDGTWQFGQRAFGERGNPTFEFRLRQVFESLFT